MEVVVTTGAIKCAKFHLKYHRQQNQHPVVLVWLPFLSRNQPRQSTEGMKFKPFTIWFISRYVPLLAKVKWNVIYELLNMFSFT